MFEIPASERVHRNQRGEVFVRYGDQNRRLDADAEREFVLERGERQFDRTVVTDATLGDLDDGQLNAFVQTMVFDDSPLALLRARHLILPQEGKDQVTWAAWLVFGKRPDAFMPQAFVRVIQYEGIAERTGERMNVVFDERAEGPLPYQIAVATDLVAGWVKNVVRLNRDGQFEYVPELPRFAWFETIVNAVTHRFYSRQGDHIRVKIFDDRMQIESPGRFPGPVRIANIRETRFSRNPSISRVLYELGLVREMNEGVNRIYDEMSAAGLPEPRFEQTDSSVRVTLLTRTSLDLDQIRIRMVNLVPVNVVPVIDVLLREGQITTREGADIIERSVPTARRYLRLLETEGWLVQISRSSRDPSGYWCLRPRSPGDPDPRT